MPFLHRNFYSQKMPEVFSMMTHLDFRAGVFARKLIDLFFSKSQSENFYMWGKNWKNAMLFFRCAVGPDGPEMSESAISLDMPPYSTHFSSIIPASFFHQFINRLLFI